LFCLWVLPESPGDFSLARLSEEYGIEEGAFRTKTQMDETGPVELIGWTVGEPLRAGSRSAPLRSPGVRALPNRQG
jgi:hypothetical protein